MQRSAGTPHQQFIVFGGDNNLQQSNESYNGTSWTEVGDLNTASRFLRWSWNITLQHIVFGGVDFSRCSRQ